MKQIILAAMAVLTLSGSTAQANDWDYFWGTTVSQGLDPKTNGWDDFWGQCQDPTKEWTACAGVVAAGTTAVIALPLIAAGIGVLAVSAAPMMGTALPVAALPIMVATPAGG